MEFLTQNLIYLVPLFGLTGLFFMYIKSSWIKKQNTGNENMQELANYIADGAMAFLKAEWKVLTYFSFIASILLFYSGTLVETSSPIIALSFLI